MRIGTGFDVHKFGDPFVDESGAATGGHIRIGGVDVPHDKEVIAHSDGDVVIHALCDAILGSLALGDIGHHFPDTDDEFKNADSRALLRRVSQLLTTNGYQLGNADITLIAQTPRVANYILSMRQHLAQDLGSALAKVSVKATTTEKLGFVGRSEGIAAEAVVLVEPITAKSLK